MFAIMQRISNSSAMNSKSIIPPPALIQARSTKSIAHRDTLQGQTIAGMQREYTNPSNVIQ